MCLQSGYDAQEPGSLMLWSIYTVFKPTNAGSNTDCGLSYSEVCDKLASQVGWLRSDAICGVVGRRDW